MRPHGQTVATGQLGCSQRERPRPIGGGETRVAEVLEAGPVELLPHTQAEGHLK